MRRFFQALGLVGAIFVAGLVGQIVKAQPNVAITDYACLVVDFNCVSILNGVPLPVTNADSGGGIAPVVSTAAEASHVLKNTAGILFSLTATNTGTGGFILVFDSATVPSDGAVTPIMCLAIGTGTTSLPATVSSGFEIGAATVNGIAVAFSSTGCFTKTLGATNIFFSAQVK